MLKRKLAVLLVVIGAMGIAVPVCGLNLDTLFGLYEPWRSFPIAGSSTYILVDQENGRLSGRGDFDVHVVSLQGGRRYKLTLSVPKDADFDLYVFDENVNEVASGTRGRGVTEVVYVTPRWTGPFFIAVRSHSGSGFYTLKLYRKVFG